MSLQTLQSDFQNYIREEDPTILSELSGKAEEGMTVYAEGYVSRLFEALVAVYPALSYLLGAEEFARLCGDFLFVHPSSGVSLRQLGRPMAAFLRDSEPYQAHADWVEMAEFEWALCEAEDAVDAPVIALSDLEAVPAEAWPDLRLKLHPSFRLLVQASNVLARWRAAKTEHFIAPECTGPSGIAIWRDASGVRFSEISPQAIVFWQAMLEDKTLDEASASLASEAEGADPEAAMTLLSWLSSAVQQGWITSLNLGCD